MQEPQALIAGTTTPLIDRMERAVASADTDAPLHGHTARSAVDSFNFTAVIVDMFRAPLGIEARRKDDGGYTPEGRALRP